MGRETSSRSRAAVLPWARIDHGIVDQQIKRLSGQDRRHVFHLFPICHVQPMNRHLGMGIGQGLQGLRLVESTTGGIHPPTRLGVLPCPFKAQPPVAARDKNTVHDSFPVGFQACSPRRPRTKNPIYCPCPNGITRNIPAGVAHSRDGTVADSGGQVAAKKGNSPIPQYQLPVPSLPRSRRGGRAHTRLLTRHPVIRKSGRMNAFTRADMTSPGTSGWSYPHWKGPFYPFALPDRKCSTFTVGIFTLSSSIIPCTISPVRRGWTCTAISTTTRPALR